MLLKECEAIFQWHPGLVLMSERPATWKGFLTIPVYFDTKKDRKIKLKLSLPCYPSFYQAQLYFGRSFAFMCNKKFNESIADLIQRASSVVSFLRLLQSLICKFIKESDKYNGDILPITWFQDLKNSLYTLPDVQVLANKSFDTIKLCVRDISLVLQKADDNIHPWKVIHSDLPDTLTSGSFENIASLETAKIKFYSLVNALENSWMVLREIDKNCWVIDPISPKPYHLYRRIYITQTLSVLITIDPLNPTSPPNLKFLGSDVDAKKQRDIVSCNIHNWDPERDFLDNLTMILNILEFPQKQEDENSSNNEDCVVTDAECCICFCLELGNEHIPDKTCDNIKCKRCFHTCCLLEWLQAVAGNEVAFGYIYGSCPHCGENISCPVK